MKRMMFLSGSVLEAEALLAFLGYSGQVVWEQQALYAYFQPRLSMDMQAIFVVTGMDPSNAGKAVTAALGQFTDLALCVGHGFVSGLVKHCEAGDPVWAAELFYEQVQQPCLSVMAFEGKVTKCSPLWQAVLCLHKKIETAVEKAGLHASSQRDVMDGLAGPWAKAIAEGSTLDFICIRAVADGGEDDTNDWMEALQQDASESLLKKSWQVLQHRGFKSKANQWLEKSHGLIHQCIDALMTKQTSSITEGTASKTR